MSDPRPPVRDRDPILYGFQFGIGLCLAMLLVGGLSYAVVTTIIPNVFTR